MPIFRKILIANRGEIALRVARACAELGVPCVAVYSDVDRDAPHVKAADEAFRAGPPPAAQSYLDVDRLMEVAHAAGCDAVHPGYGFLAENARFAGRCEREGLTFIGPSPKLIDLMGDKVSARRAAHAAGFPLVPGTLKAVGTPAEAARLAKKFGYPIAIKAAAGGGGKGLKVARDAGEIESAFSLATKEAAAYFKDGTVYVERYLARPKHVEVQVLGDKHGHVVHLGERDCSLQRRHQKLVEETPAHIGARVRRDLCAAAVKLAKSVGYDSAGTIECLVEGDEFFFLEMNTRIQVEHTITEATWGVDLVKAQIRIASGEPLWFVQKDLGTRGHAIECRVNAESPAHGFRPSAGHIREFVTPAGPGVRVDAAAVSGWTLPQEYDSLVAKLVVWGQDREEARLRMLRALGEFCIEGIDTTIPFFRVLLADELFVRGDYATPDVEAFVARAFARDVAPRDVAPRDAAPRDAAPRDVAPRDIAPRDIARGDVGRRAQLGDETAVRSVTVEVNGKRFEVRVHGLAAAPGAAPRLTPSGRRFAPPKKIATDHRSVRSPMHGIVAEIRVAAGDEIRDGQVVAIVEAMKMMNEIVAHRAGTVTSVDAKVGDTLETGQPVITLSD